MPPVPDMGMDKEKVTSNIVKHYHTDDESRGRAIALGGEGPGSRAMHVTALKMPISPARWKLYEAGEGQHSTMVERVSLSAKCTDVSRSGFQ